MLTPVWSKKSAVQKLFENSRQNSRKEKDRHLISASATVPVRKEVSASEHGVRGVAVLTLDRAACFPEWSSRLDQSGSLRSPVSDRPSSIPMRFAPRRERFSAVP